VFDAAAHAHRILAILDAGDLMSNSNGYMCSNTVMSFNSYGEGAPCSASTLYKDDFHELTKDGVTQLFCLACASVMGEHGWEGYYLGSGMKPDDVPQQEIEQTFAWLQLGVAAEVLEALENPHEYEDQKLSEASDFSLLLESNEAVFYDKAQMVRESLFLLDSEDSFTLFDEVPIQMPKSERFAHQSKDDFSSIYEIRNETNPDFHEQDQLLDNLAPLEMLDLMSETLTLTDMQKRKMRLALKKIKASR